MKISASVVLSLFASQAALAAIDGPMYPPTNGVTYAGTGDAASGTGRLNTYADMSLDGIAARWWGDAGTPIVNSLSNNANDVVEFNTTLSDLPQGVAVYDGTSAFTYLVSGSGFTTRTVQTRLTISTTDSLDDPIPMLLGSDLGIAAAAVAQVDADDFNARLLFEARDPVSGNWTPTNDLFNAYSTPQGSSTLFSINAGFYEESVPYCPADFNMDGGIDGTDVSDFFTAWENGQASADVNDDGGIDGTDVGVFFAAWEAGGC